MNNDGNDGGIDGGIDDGNRYVVNCSRYCNSNSNNRYAIYVN